MARLCAASASPSGVFILRFARTVILSRILSPHSLGAAIALMTILTSCEMLTDVGLDRFVMISDRWMRAQTVAAAQQIAVARAVLLGAAVIILAPLLADVFDYRSLTPSIRWLGLIVLVTGFRNLRIYQIQQDYAYGPEAIASISAQAAATIVVIPAAFWLHDERIIDVSLFVEALVCVVLSHALAPRERVETVDPGIRRSALAFGLPLVINGMGFVAIKQLDQVIVANLLGLASLAVYALAVNLVIAPTSLLQIIQQKVMLPLLGNHRGNGAGARLSLLILLGTTILAAAYALTVGLALDRIILFLYGPRFHVTQVFSALLALDAFVRFSRGGPNLILLHHGQTGRLTTANLAAGTGVVFALLAGSWTGRLEGVMAGLVIGDLVSFLALVCLLRQHLCLATATKHLALVTCAVAGTMISLMMLSPASLQQRVLIVLAGGCVVLLDVVLVFRGGAVRNLTAVAS